MQKTLKFLSLIWLLCFLFLRAGTANANLSQLDGATTGNRFARNYTAGLPVQNLGTGISGIFGNIELILDSYQNSTHTTEAELYECDNAEDADRATGTCALKDTYSAFVDIHGGENGTPTLIYFTNGFGYVAKTEKFYSIRLRNTNDFGAVWLWGSDNPISYPTGGLHQANGNPYGCWFGGECIVRNLYFDISGVSISPPASEITIANPESGSTITDDATELEVNWDNIDSETWTEIKIAFNQLQTNETSAVYTKQITTDSGNFSVPLSVFQIITNGSWTLRAVVENLTEINFDIPSPIYGLNFNISGLPSPCSFTDFPTWYSANSAGGYPAPSDFATSIVGFIQPIFEKAGEFTNRSLSYFDTNASYDKGQELGSVFPVMQAYLNKINIFFGGFPLMQFFEFLIITMLGIFTIRTIFKFIPFFG
jgi:hypothetical protein